MTPFTILCFAFFACLIGAVPLEQRDVWIPPITSPKAGAVWRVGEKETVTWNTTNMPPDSRLTTTTGQIVLGFLNDDGENLMLNAPLAKGFKLRDGKAEITVPNVPLRDNYIVVVFGNSGNASPLITITGGTAQTSSAAASITAPIPITGTVITGGSSTTATSTPATSTSVTSSPSEPSSSPSEASSTPTSPVSSPSASATSPAATPPQSSASSGSALPAQATGNSASRIGASSSGLLIGSALLAVAALL
ncbi:hypothetical protein HGRIS_006335 [Hohenbuehelia grisea]|uniref:Yeast cell wall synthesis Kre9/Knh1-like N-terminal domain-containing protein n=1 Tax=Hohenbuehelia grisea TaxID=104357 RepID=A0ABR3K010_9AGAR